MRSTQVAPILNLCAYLLLYFCCFNLRPASNVMLLKHWFQRTWKRTLRYRDGNVKITLYYDKYCHLFLELSCLLFLVFPVSLVEVVK